MALLLQQLHRRGRGRVATLLAAHHSSSAGWSHLRLLPARRLTVQRVVKTCWAQAQIDTHRATETCTHTQIRTLYSHQKQDAHFEAFICYFILLLKIQLLNLA